MRRQRSMMMGLFRSDLRRSVAGAVTVCSLLVLTMEMCRPVTGQNVNGMGLSNTSALLVFGDSVVDAGNNNDLWTEVKSNFPPYGIDFPGRIPSGRFSNGKVPGDLIASRMGVKEFLPAFRGTLDSSDILTGVTFASGGTGFDPLTSRRANVISMRGQLNLFRRYRGRLVSKVGATKARTILSEAKFLICSGIDDFAFTYFSYSPRTRLPLASYANFVANRASTFINDLIMLGARWIAVVGAPPIGCLPSQRTAGGGPLRVCDSLRNQAATMFNQRLTEVLQQIQVRRSGVTIHYLDMYSVLLDVIQNPLIYGFDEVTRGCCGTGQVESAMLCNMMTPITCSDDKKFLFWDAFHLTQRGYEIIVDKLFNATFLV